jgi:(E)-4-hydroxy-3-methylbut-2-enyl-diphosphate synthase
LEPIAQSAERRRAKRAQQPTAKVSKSESAVQDLGKIIQQIQIPLVVDIHFDYRLALIALEQGVHKLRINPGNIGSRENVEKVTRLAKQKGVPIRIGVNAGSLEKELIEKYGHPCPEALVESAERHVKILEDLDFHDIVISLKASDVLMTIATYRLASQRFNYPLHLGVTEAGTLVRGTVQSSAALSVLLSEGIGDTIRISLAADPVEEIRVAKTLLESLGLRQPGVRVIACPSCACADVDVIRLANEVEKRAHETLKGDISISVMGCVVNGPGEAVEADFGITGGKQKGAVYVAGKPIRTVAEGDLVEELFSEIRRVRPEAILPQLS